MGQKSLLGLVKIKKFLLYLQVVNCMLCDYLCELILKQVVIAKIN